MLVVIKGVSLSKIPSLLCSKIVKFFSLTQCAVKQKGYPRTF
jgi:hypothetical protein